MKLLRENRRRLIGSWSNIWLDFENKINEPVLIVRLTFCLMSNWTSNLSFVFSKLPKLTRLICLAKKTSLLADGKTFFRFFQETRLRVIENGWVKLIEKQLIKFKPKMKIGSLGLTKTWRYPKAEPRDERPD